MLFVAERRRSRRASKRDPRRDVRAADLQEEPTKQVENRADSPGTVVSSDPTKSAASGEHRSERSERLGTASVASEAIEHATLRM
jgi:hypothetical protein